MLLQARLVLLPVAGQFAAPHAVALQLAADLVEALLDSLEIARVFPEPFGRGLAHEAGVDQLTELGLDVVEGDGHGQVDAALEALLQAVPELEDFQGQFGQALGVLGPAAALLLGEAGQRGAVARQRVLTFKDAAVQAGQQDVLDQRVDAAQVAVQQAQLGQPRQPGAQVLGRLGQLLQQQALQGAAVLEFGFALGREAAFLDRPALLHQRRVDGQRQAGDLLLGLRLDGGEVASGDRFGLALACRQRQRSLAGLGEACGQLGQIAAFAEELALRIDHLDVHLQVAFQLSRSVGPGFLRHAGTGHARQLAAQRLG
ncbi:hypothetical protein D9M71_477130 [compost metagenome]